MKTTIERISPEQNPLHPGELLKENFGPEGLDISITEAAQSLGITRVSLSRVLNGHAGVSAELAVRLELAGISTARFWLGAQAGYDIAQTRRRKQPRVVRLHLTQRTSAELKAPRAKSRSNPVPVKGKPVSVIMLPDRGGY